MKENKGRTVTRPLVWNEEEGVWREEGEKPRRRCVIVLGKTKQRDQRDKFSIDSLPRPTLVTTADFAPTEKRLVELMTKGLK
jgi:hypothetical protein